MKISQTSPLLVAALVTTFVSPAFAADLTFEEVHASLTKFCGDCHSADDDSEESVLFLKATSVEELSQMRSLWASVAEQLNNRTMPPPDEEQPSEQERLELAGWIDETLRETACAQGLFAGSITTRRLNRIEYTNTIRDLLGVKTEAAVTFPVDGSGGEGFDNNGETLFLPPILLERYLEAASNIVDEALPSRPLSLRLDPYELTPTEKKTENLRVLKSKESVRCFPRIYAPGKHSFRLQAQAVEAASEIVVKVDGIVAERFAVEARENPGNFPVSYETSIQLSKGFHAIELRCSGPAPVQLNSLKIEGRSRNLNDEQKKFYRQLTGVSGDETPDQPRELARKQLTRFVSRAFRRPATEAEINTYLQLFDRSAERDEPYLESMKLAIKGVLVSSHFLFRVETPPSSPEPEPISDFELASRLSYFLWGSMPDYELWQLAVEEELQNEETLRQQIERMLADPRSRYLTEEFVGQWLGTREVGARVAPDTGKFKGEFTTELLLGFREEPIQLFAYILEEDRSLMELVTADYVIANKRLRKHYGLEEKTEKDKADWPWSPNPQLKSDGPFEKVSVENGQRGGVLGMGGVHLLTSYPNRTSPVLRGGWVLETLLGIHVPNPPPDIPELKPSKKEKLTVRQQLAKHREPSACSACHNLIDPPGFALDHYDVLGRWREKEDGQPIDATATFPSGDTVEGLPGLKEMLVKRKSDFYRQTTRKMLGFALGRSLDDRDDCVINQLTEHLLNGNDTPRELITQIVLSTPFRYRQQGTVEQHHTGE